MPRGGYQSAAATTSATVSSSTPAAPSTSPVTPPSRRRPSASTPAATAIPAPSATAPTAPRPSDDAGHGQRCTGQQRQPRARALEGRGEAAWAGRPQGADGCGHERPRRRPRAGGEGDGLAVRGQAGDASDAEQEDDRDDAHGEGADVGGGHHRQAAGTVEVGEQAVGAVGQTVEVEQAGEREVDGDGQGRGEQGRPQLAGAPPRQPDERPHQRADGAEPAERARRRPS